ncbi:MAG: hypothetical protein HY754_00820 [Nitrospirae bacterium]|nr:hypothetical protein [Nitrospirota bacterium]
MNGSSAGRARCSIIHLPVARCQKKSRSSIGFKKTEQREMNIIPAKISVENFNIF